MTTYGLLIFDGAEELDFTGPWEVFTASRMLRDHVDKAVLIAERPDAIRCSKGMRVLPDHTLDDHPPLDVLLVPGGTGTRREVSNPAITGWIRKTSSSAAWTTSVCTGALLLHEAGPARGRKVATHHAFEDTLQARGDITAITRAPSAATSNTNPHRPTSPTSLSTAEALSHHRAGQAHRAVAVSMTAGPEMALAEVEQLEKDGRLAGYHYLPAIKADLLRRLGRPAEAADSDRLA